jgi:hypothetical protein
VKPIPREAFEKYIQQPEPQRNGNGVAFDMEGYLTKH